MVKHTDNWDKDRKQKALERHHNMRKKLSLHELRIRQSILEKARQGMGFLNIPCILDHPSSNQFSI
jgi:hypothetical protein